MSKWYDAGFLFGSTVTALKNIDFSTSERNYEALATLHYLYFDEYTPDPNRMYLRGEVIRVGNEKYLLTNQGRIDINKPPPINSLCKLFRDSFVYEWVREEFCMAGFIRTYNGIKYQALRNVDDATPPPNNPQSWKKID